MVNPQYAGVLFTGNPLTVDDNTMSINIIPGLGENLVTGKESALAGEINKSNVSWRNREETFHGEVYVNGLIPLTKTGEQITADIEPFITELFDGAKKLAELKKIPLDIEFAIAKGKLYWLQQRPVTAMERLTSRMIYDNANIGENYPGITLPLTISFVKYTYTSAYTAMARYLGMNRSIILKNKDLFGNMVGGIYGALYYNISAWQQILYQFPFGNKTSKHITRILGMEPAAFEIPAAGKPFFLSYLKLFAKLVKALLLLKKQKKSYLENCDLVLGEYTQEKFKSKEYDELIHIYHDMDVRLAGNWLAPVLNGFFAMIFLLLVRKWINKSGIQKQYPNFVNDILFSQGDIISVRIVREYQNLIGKIQSDEKLKSLFDSKPAEEIIQILSAQFPDFYKALNIYLAHFGDRCDQGELKMETLNYREDPVRFINILKSGSDAYIQPQHQLVNFNYRLIVLHNFRYRPIRRFLLNYFIKKTLTLIRNRENYRFIRTRVFSLIRSLFRALDESYFKNSWIENRGDLLFLELSELIDSNRSSDYKKLILKRKQEYELYSKIKRCNRYSMQGKSIIPVNRETEPDTGKIFKGTGCCSGMVINRVKIITPETIEADDYAGQILVASYFEPGWINVFSQAAGVISEKGNLLSHTAILCREMGIPTIIGARGIVSLLRNGDLIQMNGSTGEINIVEHGK